MCILCDDCARARVQSTVSVLGTLSFARVLGQVCCAAITCFLGAVTSSAQIDPAVKLAPQWNCDGTNAPRVLWRTRVGDVNGPLVASGPMLLATAATNGNGVVVALDERGKHLWASRHAQLPERVHDMGQGIRSRPAVDGNRIYYVSNRGELMCVDRDARTNATVLWKLDMVAQLGVFKREAGDVGNSVSSPLVAGDLVFCVTGHGARRFPDSERATRPCVPSFIAVDKFTGRLVWSSDAPGTNIIYSQWSSPVFARIGGRGQVIFPGGDGFLYAFEPQSGAMLWKFDCNEPGLKAWRLGDLVFHLSARKNFFVGSPVVSGTTLLVGLNKDFEMAASAPLLAIDLAAANAPRLKWKFSSTNFASTYTSAAVCDGIVFVVSDTCVLFALDLETGRELWHSRLAFDGRNFYASPVVSGRRVFVSDDTGVTVFAASRQKRCFGRYELGALEPSTPVIHRGRLHVAAGGEVWALETPGSPVFDAARKWLQRLRRK